MNKDVLKLIATRSTIAVVVCLAVSSCVLDTQEPYLVLPGAGTVAIASGDIDQICRIVDQVAVAEKMQRYDRSDASALRRYEKRQAFGVPPTQGSVTIVRVTRTANGIEVGIYLTEADSDFFTRRVRREIVTRLEALFGKSRIVRETSAYNPWVRY